MTLSRAQQKILDEAKREIDEARSIDFLGWYKQHFTVWTDDDEALEDYLGKSGRMPILTEMYEGRKKGIVGTMANTRSLKKLEELGLIKILYDSTGETHGIDKIKVENY